MNWFFHTVLHDFEVKNSVSNNKRIELSDIQVFSIMSWLSVNSFVFSLDWKNHFNLDFVLKSFRYSKGDVWEVLCWQLYEMNPQNCRRKNLDDEVTENRRRRYGEFKLLPMLQWLILNLLGNFLAFYNHLVSQVRDLMRPWNSWKYVSLTNKVYLWNHSIFDDICKNLFLVCNLHNNHFT